MKAKAVPALRSKRGLRRGSGAEPQVVGLTPQTTVQRKASTMKTYILRDPKTVERQNPPQNPPSNPPPASLPKPWRNDPAGLALVDPIAGPVLCIGLARIFHS